MTVQHSSSDDLISEHAFTTAVKAVSEASRLVLRYWPNPTNSLVEATLIMKIMEKPEGIGNFATTADVESEGVMIAAV